MWFQSKTAHTVAGRVPVQLQAGHEWIQLNLCNRFREFSRYINSKISDLGLSGQKDFGMYTNVDVQSVADEDPASVLRKPTCKHLIVQVFYRVIVRFLRNVSSSQQTPRYQTHQILCKGFLAALLPTHVCERGFGANSSELVPPERRVNA